MPLLHSQRIVQGRFGTGGGGGGGEVPISKIVQRDYIFLHSLFHPFPRPPHRKGSRRGDTHREPAGVRWTTFLSSLLSSLLLTLEQFPDGGAYCYSE